MVEKIPLSDDAPAPQLDSLDPDRTHSYVEVPVDYSALVFGPPPPLPKPLHRREAIEDVGVDPFEAFPLEQADVIAIGRVVSVEDICEPGRYRDSARTRPVCTRQVVTLEVEHAITGVDEGQRLIVLKKHPGTGFIVGARVSEDWSAQEGALSLLMLQPANDLGVREPLYARSYQPADGVTRASWTIHTPRGMTNPLLTSPRQNYFRCSETELVLLSPYAAREAAQTVVTSKEFVPTPGESGMIAYQREANAILKAEWADHSCDPVTLATLLRTAIHTKGATEGGD